MRRSVKCKSKCSVGVVDADSIAEDADAGSLAYDEIMRRAMVSKAIRERWAERKDIGDGVSVVRDEEDNAGYFLVSVDNMVVRSTFYQTVGGATLHPRQVFYDLRIIYVSLAAINPLERTFEESGHALRAAGLIPAADYGILRTEGQRLGAREHFEIDTRYGETYGRRWQGAALEDRLEEEAIMQMIAAHARGKTFGEPSSAARRVLDRIVKFLRGVGELLRGRGFRTYEDVFDDMMSGRMARPQLPEIAAAGRVQAMRDALTATGARSADGSGDTSPARDAMLSLGEGTPPPDIRDVINGAAAEGRLSRDDAAALLQRLEALERHYRDNPAEAAQALRAEVDAEAQRRQRLALLTREAHERVENFVEQYRDARGQADPAKATIALLEHHGQTPMPDGASSVVGRRQAIIGMSMAQMEGALHEFRRTWVRGTTRNRARLENMVREAFGEGTGDQAAAGFARVWAQVAEELRQRFNAAGGHIGQLKNWGLPQHHDRRALLNAGMETWIASITPRLDLAAMRNALTGGPMTAADLRVSLEYIWRNITADGWIEREPSMARFGIGIVANQRADHRFLHFRNADAWLEYQAEFGGGADPFAAMMGHIRGMAEDIAAMEILGPNPRGMLTWLQQFTLQQAALRASGQPAHFPAVAEITGRRMAAAGNWLTTKGAEDHARNAVTLSDNMWDIYRGAAGAVVNQRIADTFGTVRNTNVASKLGGAALSAVTDLGFQKMARYFAGLPVTRSWGDVFRAFQLNKRDAVRAGLILDTASNILHQEARWAGAMQGRNGPPISRTASSLPRAWRPGRRRASTRSASRCRPSWPAAPVRPSAIYRRACGACSAATASRRRTGTPCELWPPTIPISLRRKWCRPPASRTWPSAIWR